jgi:RNA polymerase sigma-70 factor (ECF subfamily)
VTKAEASRQVQGVSGSEPDDFDAIYQRELDYVWRTLGRLGVPPADIADAAHDVFVVVYRRWSELDPGRPVRGWLFGIARKVAAGRRRKHREVLEADADLATTDDPHRLDRDLLWRALSMLADDRIEVLVLHDLEGYTGAEIAASLDLSPNTVHSRLRLARADLLAAVERLRGTR